MSMQIRGMPWWLLVGMFGFGAAVGVVVTVLVGRKRVQPRQGEWFEPCYRMFAALLALAVIPLLAGLLAVALAFAAHRAGWDKPLPYLAGFGLVFLLLAAGWILWTICKPSPSHIPHDRSAGPD